MTSLKEIESFWGKVCFDPNYQPEGRYQTYRELVFEGMMDVLQSVCPVARGILNEQEWQKIFWEFLTASPPQSVVIRELPFEVAQYLKNHPHVLHQNYPWLGELMEYEYLEVQVRFAPEDEASTPAGQVRLNPAHALAAYQWPVHFISEDHHDSKDLPQGEYFLFLWRDPKNLEVKFMEVNPLVAVLFQMLEIGPQEPEALLQAVAERSGMEGTDEYLQEGRQVLQQLVQQGILFHNSLPNFH